MLKVLGLSGTPRKDGNSDQLLQYALQPFYDAGAEVQLIRYANYLSSHVEAVKAVNKVIHAPLKMICIASMKDFAGVMR